MTEQEKTNNQQAATTNPIASSQEVLRVYASSEQLAEWRKEDLSRRETKRNKRQGKGWHGASG